MKTVIIACGSGIATSTMISMRIDELLTAMKTAAMLLSVPLSYKMNIRFRRSWVLDLFPA